MRPGVRYTLAMPELPEVESYARIFAAHGLRKPIAGVRVLDERILAVRRERFVRTLRGATFSSVRRHGKHLFVDAGSSWLHIHFGMSGDLTPFESGEGMPRFTRVAFDFNDGSHLAFEDMRLFGIVDLAASPDRYVEEHRLGPDALDPKLTLRRFRERIATRRGVVKALLMSQDVVAGLGNLYVDEALYRAGINPARPRERLSDDDVASLYRQFRGVLREAVARRTTDRDLPPSWLAMRREEGERCLRCGGTLRRAVVFGRTTYYCGRHQRV